MKPLQTTMLSAVIIALICTSMNDAKAAKYLKPGEFKELFKLEKVPLQVDSMKELSKHLTVLAQRKQDASAMNRRATGQLLVLAMRLDPANQDARDTNRAMLRNVAHQTSEDDAIIKAKARIRFFQQWLSNPQAGDDANALSKYMADATKVLKQETMTNADQADWSDVIPSLAFYEQTEKNNTMPETAEKGAVTPPIPSSGPEQNSGVVFQIPTLKINMPLAMETATKYRDPTNPAIEKTRYDTNSVLTSVEVVITPKEDQGPFSIVMTSKLGKNNEASKGLIVAIASLAKSYPSAKGSAGSVKFDQTFYSYKNGSSAIAAIQLMLQASIANKPLREDTYLCASLDENGKLCLPPNFWTVLTALRKEKTKRGRLIVPKTAIEPLTQLLVFGEPDFFTRWEVYTCETTDQALAVAAKTSDQKITAAGKLFAPVQKLSGKNDVTKLAVNRAVRKRLSEIVGLTPNHLSARLLLLQGSGKRPMRLSKTGLAFHLQPLIKEMSQALLVNTNPDSPSASLLKKLHVNSRAKLDPMERIVNRNDKLYQETLQLANDVRSLELLIKRNTRDQNNSASRIKTMVINLQTAVTALNVKVDTTIQSASGK